MDQRIINLFDEYTHKPLTREEFITRLAKLTGSMTAALTILPLLEVNYASAATVSPQDNRISVDRITYDADGTIMKAYQVIPKDVVGRGAIVVIHENRGLNAHIE